MSLVPTTPDTTVHIVLDRIGEGCFVYREIEEDQSCLDTLIDDTSSGQYNDPFRIVAFNTAEGWSRDVTEDVAREVLARAVKEDRTLSGHIRAFVERETGETVPSPQ
jgi:hypothetical protein